MSEKLLFALSLTTLFGCERGCLASWLAERGVGGATPTSSGHTTPGGGSMDLSGTDCSDGLLRCVDGRLEASRAAHLPASCGATPERPAGCTCPWDPLGRCTSGCVEDGLEVAGAPDVGAQLCRPSDVIAIPVPPHEAPEPLPICATEGIACVEQNVRVCDRPGQPVRALARCVHGCQPGIAIDHGESANLDGVVTILCRRGHAEHR